MLQVAALSDVDCRRSNNEDSFGYDAESGIYVVSDSTGGSAAGEIARHIAVETVVSSYRAMLADDIYRNQQKHHLLQHAVVQASAAVDLLPLWSGTP